MCTWESISLSCVISLRRNSYASFEIFKISLRKKRSIYVFMTESVRYLKYCDTSNIRPQISNPNPSRYVAAMTACSPDWILRARKRRCPHLDGLGGLEFCEPAFASFTFPCTCVLLSFSSMSSAFSLVLQPPEYRPHPTRRGDLLRVQRAHVLPHGPPA